MIWYAFFKWTKRENMSLIMPLTHWCPGEGKDQIPTYFSKIQLLRESCCSQKIKRNIKEMAGQWKRSLVSGSSCLSHWWGLRVAKAPATIFTPIKGGPEGSCPGAWAEWAKRMWHFSHFAWQFAWKIMQKGAGALPAQLVVIGKSLAMALTRQKALSSMLTRMDVAT